MSIERYTTAGGKVRWRAEHKSTSRTGKKNRISRSFDTKAEAKGWLANQTVNAGAGGQLAKGTLGSYLRGWLSARETSGAIRPNTLSGYRGKVETCIKSIGHVQMHRLAVEDVEAWLGDLAGRGLAPSTISQSRAILHKALKDAVRKRLLPYNPVEGAEGPKVAARPRPKTDTMENARKFLAAMDATGDGPLFRLMAMTGMRRSEAGALAWAAVDLDGAALRVERTLMRVSGNGTSSWVFGAPKSRTSRRRIPLPPAAVELLRARLVQVKRDKLAAGRAWENHDLVFCDPYGAPLKLDAVSARARRMRAKLGLPEGVQGVHGLRHLFGTMQNKSGTDVKTLQTLLGHSRASTTLDLYVEADDDLAAAAAARIGDLLG
ncbi:site-specific integrase [uncultured Albimonas sp.]|uniref:tyrosine-type recombinase/integrase n=1 Tax=uncultured Albimonas sp. TaxID=1331701 RepID=UPI0030EC5204|tara:strand:+ start:4930 stop:6060 length:1131 start_codon:yes stop_codon:yes gene_type:complete